MMEQVYIEKAVEFLQSLERPVSFGFIKERLGLPPNTIAAVRQGLTDSPYIKRFVLKRRIMYACKGADDGAKRRS